ncbi:Major facilitator superfamily domain, general substrate transporter [Cordyceps fumosorosea ARSEF 2679]|uniref:Major facilitator superfamily domain, general substrate transporter n=1 Tax=Cordyceps fumosorosea (strain ARSEF 2679) TaxID=1081104 RepID=A0A162JT61_CORFA|nr:Major facilitator superfamily domain, general substrate transporter [Cordyceps fumosorosea ARSEF 2679]OAA73402.1 Major facilitator superfamily domain, general substrate transporter [Cordyceps fumosorosea ARSEF 2679]
MATSANAAPALDRPVNVEATSGDDSATEMNVDEKADGTAGPGPPPEDDSTTKKDNAKAEATEQQIDYSATAGPRPPGLDDEGIVFWDGDDDPHNPYNWPNWVKVFNCVLISALTFVTPLASSMFAPGVPNLMREFHSSSEELAAFCVSVYILGFAAGPMLFAPLSELYGRTRIYHVANIGFIAFLIGCALAPSLKALIVFRFLSGVFGSCPVTNGGGSISDMITQRNRGAAMAGFSVGPLLGPIIGPVVGGVVADKLSWRWVFWVLAALAGALALLFLLLARETYAPVLLQRKTDRLCKETGDLTLRSKLDAGLAPGELFTRAILRPFKLLAFSPICAICNVFVGVAYGYLYIMFTSITPLFQRQYGFDGIHAGLAFLGLGVGSMLGVGYFSSASDRYMKKKAREAGEAAAVDEELARRPSVSAMKPEHRLPPLRIGAVLLPVGLFIYGWTAQYKVHWIVPIIGTAIMGVGNLIIFMALQLYLVDTFTIYAASALAANSVVRSLLGAVLPLAGGPMYAKLGLGWGNSLLAFIAVALIPVPWLFMRYGEFLRKKFAIENL